MGKTRYFPLAIDFRERIVLVVGGGEIATRKVRLLLSTEAIIHVVAPDITQELYQLAEENPQLHLKVSPYDILDLNDVRLVIVATDDSKVQQQVVAEAKVANILVNAVDQVALCDVIFLAIVDRFPLLIGISSGGQAPVLVRLLRARLESLVPAGFGKLAGWMGHIRNKVKQVLPNVDQRRHWWEKVIDGPIGESVMQGQDSSAEIQAMQSLYSLEQGKTSREVPGVVYLVGAGPGDPDLLTFRALRLMQKADVVVYDRLVSDAILDRVRRDAERVYVGKSRLEHTMVQSDINALLVKLAKEGKQVCRLKGGDPFLFGRGGEEIETLMAENIPFEVVPGITAASGCAAYAGIPLTHRDHAQSVVFVTGHSKTGEPDLDWSFLVRPMQTVVIYMGLARLSSICSALIRAGMSPDMPAAIIENGTTQEQRVLTATIEHLADQALHYAFGAPTLVIIGNVVKLHQQLTWFNSDSTVST
ncbi:MAG: siroheme synthase CysG [Pseudomonadota bacterium]